MIPVEQRQPYAPNQAVGDCWKCCIASILELDYDDVPHFTQLEEEGTTDSWWNLTQGFLRLRGCVLARFGLWGAETPMLIFGSKKIRYHFSVPGHWIASVVSPRMTPEGENLSHAVVMNGSTIAWDPHPSRDEGHLGFTEAYLLVAT